jgi:hypothetical protein
MKFRCALLIAYFLVCLCTFTVRLEAEPVVLDGVTYDDDTVAKLITVITTTNPIPSIPDVKHLYSCQKSLSSIPALAKCKKIIVFDGIQPNYESRKEDYDEYKKRVTRLVKKDPYFSNTRLVFCPSWAHLSGAIQKAFRYVNTPYVLIQQHDFTIIKNFDINGIVATLAANPYVKHVKLEYNPTNAHARWWNGPVDGVVDGTHFVPLTRIFGWSDVTHVTTAEYYKNFVLPQCDHGFMEHFLHPAFQRDIEKFGLTFAQQIYGTYLYGDIQDGGYIYHSDGRGS